MRFNLILENYLRNPFRSITLSLLVAVLASILWVGGFLSQSLTKGLKQFSGLDADILHREGLSIPKEKCFEDLDFDLQRQLETLEISDLLNELPTNLSGGELQKISIVRALVNHPGILIADKPISSLDERNAQHVLKLFSKLTSIGTAIIRGTHDVNALRRADRSYIMQRGQLISREVSEYGNL